MCLGCPLLHFEITALNYFHMLDLELHTLVNSLVWTAMTPLYSSVRAVSPSAFGPCYLINVTGKLGNRSTDTSDNET